jgi:hypothetical protein
LRANLLKRASFPSAFKAEMYLRLRRGCLIRV